MAPLSLLLFITLVSISSSQTAKATSQILLTLTHTLSHSPNSTAHNLLKASAARSAARHQQRRQVSLPLSPGSDYTLSLSLSTSTTVNLYMDTGSDLVWFPCSPFECILCDGKPPLSPSPPPPPPTTSTPLSCASPFCSAAHSKAPSSDLCAAASCPLDAIETSSCHSPCPAFYYAYGDGSLIGHLRRGQLSLTAGGGGQDDMLQLDHFTFACAHSTLAEPIGVAGFGGGRLSLPAQLGTLHPGLGGRFSYCLVSHAFSADRLVRPSPLILGRVDEPDRFTYTYTPMLSNPKHPYYYSVGLEAVTVGKSWIPAGLQLSTIDLSGNGGMVVDSGTTFTMLPSGLYAQLTSLFDRTMNQTGFARATVVERGTGLGPCYWYDGREDSRRVPGLAFHFDGNASVVLPRRNYFMGYEHEGRRAGCLMLMDGGNETADGPAATMGNYQQQGFEVVYDLEGRRVGFARRPCAAMWDEVSRG